MTQENINSNSPATCTDLSENTRLEIEMQSENGGKKDVDVAQTSNEPPSTLKEKESESGKNSTVTKRTLNSSTNTSSKTTPSTINKAAGTSRTSTKISSTTSSTRKTSSDATTSGAGHNSTSDSSGGLGSEKRRSLTSGSRRSSLVLTSQNSSSKTESLAEKRGMPVTHGRKPITSTAVAGTRPNTKPVNTTTKTTVNRNSAPPPATKPSISGTLPDSSKRLSINSQPAISGKSGPRTSTFSKEIDDMKTKLANYEIKINAQETEASSAQARYDDLNRQLVEEAKNFNLLENNIRKEHNEQVEKLNTEYRNELQRLNVELEKANSALTVAQESSTKSIEEIKQSETLKSDAVIKKLKDEYEISISKLKTELAAAHELHKSTASALSESETKIISLESKIQHASEKLKTLESENQKEITLLEQNLAEKYESALSDLKREHQINLNENNSSLESAHQKTITDISRQYEDKIRELQTDLTQCKADLASAQATQQQILEKHAEESSEKILNLENEIKTLRSEAIKTMEDFSKSLEENKILNEKLKSSQMSARASDEKLRAMSIELESFKEKFDLTSQALVIAEDDLFQTRAQLTSKTEMMETFETDGKSKDEMFKKIQKELDAAKMHLEERNSEVAQIQDLHLHQVEEISLGYEKKINDLQEKSIKRAELDDLKAKNEKLVINNQDLLATHENSNETIQNHVTEICCLRNTILDLEAKIKERQVAHEKALKEAGDKSQNTHLTNPVKLCDIKAKYEEDISKLKEYTQSLSISSSNTEELKITLSSLQNQVVDLENCLAKAQNGLGISQKCLGMENIDGSLELSDSVIAEDIIKQKNSQ